MNLQRRISAIMIGAIATTLACLQLASAAPPVKVSVTGAEPGSALQGDALEVVISGSGFGHGATVRYLVTNTNDDSQITVDSVVYNEADGTLTTQIQVQGEAQISDYDIEVQAAGSGRKGKGTTLFKVLSSNGGGNSEPLLTISCDELFGFAPGTCTAEGTIDPCMFLKEFIEDGAWKMTQHCDTRQMLVVSPDDRFLFGNGYRLNLVSPWISGYAGITNTDGASRIASFHIVAHGPDVAAGCDAVGKVETAIHFDPDRGVRSGMPRGSVVDITVESQGGAQLCNGIEVIGSDPYIGNPYKSIQVEDNHVMADSYAQAGIWMANINLSDLNDQVKNEFAKVTGNVVESTGAACAAGILVGPSVERPQINDNLVMAPSGAGCALRTVGIGVLDSGRNKASPMGANYDFLTARAAEMKGNTVHTGGDGSIGILVDATTTAELTGSQITAGDGGDYGVCVETGADFSETRKRSTFIGFGGNEIVTLAGCGAALP